MEQLFAAKVKNFGSFIGAKGSSDGQIDDVEVLFWMEKVVRETPGARDRFVSMPL